MSYDRLNISDGQLDVISPVYIATTRTTIIVNSCSTKDDCFSQNVMHGTPYVIPKS